MEKVNQAPLFDPKAAQYVLGCIMHQPSLLYNDGDRYILTVDDFNNKIYNILFGAIYNLSYNGAEKITSINIDLYLSAYALQYETYIASNGNDLSQLIYDITEDFDLSQFNLYYDRVKKFSTLRELKNRGISIDEFYNPNFLNQEEEEKRFNKLTVNDILNKVRAKIQLVENHNVTKQESSGCFAAKGIRNLIQNLKEVPEIGIPLEGEIINYATRGCRKGKMYLYSAPSGGGKALLNGSKVITPNGEKNIEELVVGEDIFGEDGKVYKVEGVFPQGKKQVYEVEFSDGSVISCCNEHYWNYQTASLRDSKSKTWKTKTLQEIIDTEELYKIDEDGHKEWQLYIPMTKPLEFKSTELPIPAYTLGALLGRGYFREDGSCSFSSTEEDVVNKVNEELMTTNQKLEYRSNYDYDITQIYFQCKSEMKTKLEQLGLIHTKSDTKFIPKEYKYGNVTTRRRILAGLIDTDGVCVKEQSYDYITASKQLAEDVCFICESLGFTVTKSIKECDYTNDNGTIVKCKNGYSLHIKTSNYIPRIHWCKRKESQFKLGQGEAHRSIREIRKLDQFKEMTCIRTSNPTSLFLTNHCVVTHNTRTLVGNACSIAFPRIENGKIVKRKVLEPVLFIATEMQADEIQTLILAWISGVNEEKILMNQMTEDEEKLINIAVNIMEKYDKNFIIESIPDPSIRTLKSLITNYIIQNNLEYIFYDYIFSSPGLIDEFKGINLREDVVLMMLSNTLKEICASYNIYMMSATQLNGEWEKKTIRNANMIRGSKAICDKVDVGMIGVRCPPEELESVKSYCEQMNLQIPNIVIDIYKNRRGKMCDVKIFRKFDYGTCRTQDIVITTTNYKVVEDVIILKYDLEYQNLMEYTKEK